jgi:hypothetical protein
MIVASNGSDTILFYSRFDDDADKYLGYYECYKLPRLSALELEGTWVGLENRATDRLPDVPLNALPFELPRRK